MKKYNVNIDREKPSSEEILSRRDFDGLMKQYNTAPSNLVKKPFWKSGWFIGSVATVAVLTSGVFIFNNNKETNSTNQTTVQKGNTNTTAFVDTLNQKLVNVLPAKTKRKISPPISSLEIRNHAYHFNSSKGCVFTHISGTKITFPENAFVDENGNSVSGNVDVEYREFHDQVDFFLSGIPMEYDSAGNTYQFQSAGMMEISGMINGKPVFLAKDKKVKIEFASEVSGPKYNLYRFDTLAGNWNYLGKDNPEILKHDTKKDSANAVAAAMKGTGRICGYISGMVKPTEPSKPLKANKHKNRFTVAVDPVEFPEMKDYKDMVFEVDESSQKFEKSWYNITWESIKLSRGNKENAYKIALNKSDSHVMLDVYPVLEDKRFDDAMAEYDKKMIIYKDELEKYKQFLDQQRAAEKGVFVNEDGTVIKTVDGGFMYYTKAKEKDEALAETTMRAFTISEFGVYNMDNIAMLPKGGLITLSVNGSDNKLFSGFATMYHVDRNMQSLFTYHNQNPLTGFSFNPSSSNLIWAVKDGVLYYTDNDQFKNLSISGSGNVALKPVAKTFRTADDMKKFFRIGKGI
ncbi:hypothetical protein BH09BAC5_BH09BAC5_07970 [soil metagenome]